MQVGYETFEIFDHAVSLVSAPFTKTYLLAAIRLQKRVLNLESKVFSYTRDLLPGTTFHINNRNTFTRQHKTVLLRRAFLNTM